MKPSNAQMRLLRAVNACSAPDSPAEGWGEVYSHFDRANGTPSSLEMRNFDRTAWACERHGWLKVDKDGSIALTDAGMLWLLARAFKV
jgi:hypothetical protein